MRPWAPAAADSAARSIGRAWRTATPQLSRAVAADDEGSEAALASRTPPMAAAMVAAGAEPRDERGQQGGQAERRASRAAAGRPAATRRG